jgi:class 3 adenylate cyclase
MPTEERQLAAIMFTDMVGYSAMAQRDEALALELLEEHRGIVREVLARFHGTEIKTIIPPVLPAGVITEMCPGNSDSHSSADSLFAIFLRASADPVTN